MSRRDTYGSSRRPKFNIGNIVGDPFALATVSTAIIGWIIAFAGSVLAKIDDKNSIPNYTWWTVGSLLCCIIGVSVTVAYNTIFTYHVAIVGFLSACLVFTTSSVNSFVYSDVAAKQAAAAGFILLSMIVIVWIFYFGSQPTASHRHVIGNLAMNKDSRILSPSSRNPPASFRPETAISQQQPQMYTSAQLSGFETSSPVTGYPGGAVGENRRNSEARFGTPSAVNQPATSLLAPNGGMADRPESTGGPTEYPYRARAIYSYEADPADANEISFTKNEILDVSDVSGRWWQAKKSNGETGIAPSNYLILM